MSEFKTIETLDELLRLDDREILEGFVSGLKNESHPGSDKSKSFWHGWRNGMVEAGHAEMDGSQLLLRSRLPSEMRWIH